jgi:hypothetical protein
MYFLRYGVWSSSKSKYIDLTVKTPEVVRAHRKASGWSFNWTLISRKTRCTHRSHLFDDKTRLKPMFRGDDPITCATVTFGWLTITTILKLNNFNFSQNFGPPWVFLCVHFCCYVSFCEEAVTILPVRLCGCSLNRVKAVQSEPPSLFTSDKSICSHHHLSTH